MTGFQKQVNLTPALALPGDFASSNPRATVLAGEGDLVTGAGGATVGVFAWANANGLVLNTGSGAPTGFVHREQQALITIFLAETSNLIPAGMPITLHNEGDFWALLTGPNAAVIGSAINAVLANGNVTAGAAVGGTSVATRFKAQSAAAVGELVKISTWG